MRYTLLVLALLAIGLVSCKEDSNNTSNEKAEKLFRVTNVLEMANEKFLEFGANKTDRSPAEALVQTGEWLAMQTNDVASVEILDSTYLLIKTVDNIFTGFSYVLEGSDGLSVYRGGGKSGSGLSGFMGSGDCSNKMSNKKVLIYAAAHDEFYSYGEMDAIAARLTNAGKGLEVTVLKNEACTPEAVKTFKDFGLVIIDTHGYPESFMTGLKVSFPNKASKPKDAEAMAEAFADQIGDDRVDLILEGKLMCKWLVTVKANQANWTTQVSTGYKYPIFLTSSYINDIGDLSGTIVFGNMCYSGYGVTTPDGSTGIRTAIMARNPISYYGYTYSNNTSTEVSNYFAKRMEDTLIQRMIINGDSTKIVHFRADNTTEFIDTFHSNPPLYFKHYGNDTYCYGCGGSFTDARDGQTYRTVCIGNKVWMADNLNYDAPLSECYDGDGANCTLYGRLYDWATVMAGQQGSYANPSGVRGVCPTGWHLPSESEWQVMLYNFGADSVAGGALKEISGWDAPNIGATNSSGFNAKPAGEYLGGSFGYTYKGTQALWWTATPSANSSSSAIGVGLTNTNASAIRYGKQKTEKLSCRCVQD
ncbi:MAG: FISUMP domain-containing protein [Chitinophagales bacterium]|nr:FISUMP domain-containing protein [Chitinophagales bacterium]